MQKLMEDNSEVFQKQLGTVLNPSFDIDRPDKYDEIIDRILSSTRQSFPMQAQKVAAIATEFAKKNTKAIILSAEMGSGKSDMASKIAVALANKTKVNMILCPPHLVDKWEDEINLSKNKNQTFKIIKVTRWEDLVPYTKRDMRKDGCIYFFIVSRENAKLGYPKVGAFKTKKRTIYKEIISGDNETHYIPYLIDVHLCPDCDTELFEKDLQEEVSNNDEIEIPRKCECCGSILRDVDRSKSRKLQTRLSISEYIKRQWTKGQIEFLIVDEIHEYKGGNTGQGNALAQIASVSKKILGLTGTLLNGYASSLFYILYRLNPNLMKKKLGLEYTQVKEFVNAFGAYERKFEAEEVNEEGVVTKKGRQIGSLKEKPKVSPHLLSVLLDMVVFLRLDEIKMEKGKGLPPYKEEIVLVKQDEALKDSVERYISKLANRAKNDPTFLGNLANDSIGVPDMPFQKHVAQNEIKYIPEFTREEYGKTNKEKKLIELVRSELNNDRQVLVYIHFSNKGVGKDIKQILSEEFPHRKVNFLPPSIKAKNRQKWIRENPCDILICNPELVKTGLDLLEFPTIIFYETTYNVCATC